MSLPMPGFEWNHSGISNVLEGRGWYSLPLSKTDDSFVSLRLIKFDGVRLSSPQVISLNRTSVSHYIYSKYGKDSHALFDELKQRFYFCESPPGQNIPYLAAAFTYKLVDGFSYIDENISGVAPDVSKEPAKRHQMQCYGKLSRNNL